MADQPSVAKVRGPLQPSNSPPIFFPAEHRSWRELHIPLSNGRVLIDPEKTEWKLSWS